jgi:glycosyltransferase involved in cell wall biosynthesis
MLISRRVSAAVLVSIVIPARNSAKTLPLTLRSIKRQTYPHIEVIVVDGRSSDNAAEIARSYGARVITTRPNRSLQRNAGALLARGDILYFVDADFYLTPGVVQECVDLIHSGADAVIVLNISNPLKGTVAKIRYYERMSYYGSGTYEAARCMTRRTFWKAGGYDPQLYANEDYDLHARIAATGAKTAHTRKNFEIHLDEPATWRELIAKSLYYGRNITKYLTKNPNPAHITPIRPTYLKKEYAAWATRKWTWAIPAVIIQKTIQAYATAIGKII